MFSLLSNIKFLAVGLVIFVLLYSGGSPIDFLQEKTYWVADKINEGLNWFRGTEFYDFLTAIKENVIDIGFLKEVKNKGVDIMEDYIQNPNDKILIL